MSRHEIKDSKINKVVKLEVKQPTKDDQIRLEQLKRFKEENTAIFRFLKLKQ